MKKIILGVAVSAALFSIEASALSTSVIPVIAATSPSKVDWSTTTGVQNVGNVPAANVVYANGSSAATKFLGNAILAVAAPNTIVYKYVNGTAADILTYVFTTGATPPTGFVANQNYIVHKRDRDGSLMAPMSATGLPGTAVVNAVTYNSLPNFALPATVTATTCVATTAPSPTAAGLNTCTVSSTEVLLPAPATATGLAGKAGILGIADVDAVQFASPLNGANTANLLTTKAATMGSIPVAAQVFGIAVNLKLRDAMQVAEVASGALTNALCASDAVVRETEACMPSFTSEQISSIFAQGRFNDWTNLSYGTNTNLVSANTATKPANTAVQICSRAAGSGTLATVNTVYENAPCTASNEAIQAATSATVNPVAINTVTTNEGAAGATKAYYSTVGSGDVENCLKTMDSFSATAPGTPGYGNFALGTGQVPTFTPAAAAGGFRWAVGILNADRNTANALPYRFVKIDGYAPSLANTANGKYRFWSELSAIKATAATALTGGSLGLYNAMIDPAIIAKSTATNPAGFTTGYMGVASTAVSGATAFDPLRPVMPFTHQNLANTAGSVNHCRAATIMSGATKYLPWLN